MIFNSLVLYNSRLIYQKFIIVINDMSYITVYNSSDKQENISIPICNSITGIYYIPVIFPLKIEITNNVFNVEENIIDFDNTLLDNNIPETNIESSKLNYINKLSRNIIQKNRSIDFFYNIFILLKSNPNILFSKEFIELKFHPSNINRIKSGEEIEKTDKRKFIERLMTNKLNKILLKQKIEELLINSIYYLSIDKIELSSNIDIIIYVLLRKKEMFFELNQNCIKLIETLIIILHSLLEGNIDCVYKRKLYTNNLTREMLKVFIYNSDNTTFLNNFSVEYFNRNVNKDTLDKFIRIYSKNNEINNICNVIDLEANNMKHMFEYFSYIFNSKINYNIIQNIHIQNIIEYPNNLYHRLHNVEDFIEWSRLIKNRLYEFYYVKPRVNFDNRYINFGIIIYLLFQIKEQTYNCQSYYNLVIYCKNQLDIVTYENKINIMLKEFFLKRYINLGLLMSHIKNENKNY